MIHLSAMRMNGIPKKLVWSMNRKSARRGIVKGKWVKRDGEVNERMSVGREGGEARESQWVKERLNIHEPGKQM